MQPNAKCGLLVNCNSIITQEQLDQMIHRDACIEDTYEVEKECFARGKFAQVRRVRHKATSVVYAAKTIKKRRTRCANAVEEIMHEIRVLMTMEHCPNIVHLKEVFETKNEFVLILELAKGGELQEILDDEETIPEDVCRSIMWQIVQGLRHLHSHSIAHLDLKPQNILLTSSLPEGEVKLCDFGISRLITHNIEIREIMGTVDYMPPEVLHYEPISLASDMWSVGIVAYVLLSGHSPFGDDDKVRTYSNITSSELDFPRKLFTSVSEHAKDFIKRLLIRDPRKRMTTTECLEHVWLKPLTQAYEAKTARIEKAEECNEQMKQILAQAVENVCDNEALDEDNEKENMIKPMERMHHPTAIMVEASIPLQHKQTPNPHKRLSSDIFASSPKLTAFISNESINKKSESSLRAHEVVKTTTTTTCLQDDKLNTASASGLLVDDVFETTTCATVTASIAIESSNSDSSPSPPMTPNKKFYLSVDADVFNNYYHQHHHQHRASAMSLTPRRSLQIGEQEVTIASEMCDQTQQHHHGRSISMERLSVEHHHHRSISETCITNASHKADTLDCDKQSTPHNDVDNSNNVQHSKYLSVCRSVQSIAG